MAKICTIINDRFCYRLVVDGEDISFQGAHNADYFARLYTDLGYTVFRKNQQYEG